MDKRTAKEYLYQALEIGELMLISGAEVSRVEDSIQRICYASGAQRVDVFTITSSIIVTMYSPDYGPITQTRRISHLETDLHQLDLLNQLSRKISNEKLSIEEIKAELNKIKQPNQYPFYLQFFFYAMISGAFAMFFGGSYRDAIASALVGILLKALSLITEKIQLNSFFAALLCSVSGGLFAILFVQLKIGESVSMISIGNVMLLIPGIALTNSMRDMFNGDTISGTLRFVESILLASTIAFGFAIASQIGGYVL